MSAWLGCCVRLPGLVCQSCLPACLPSGLRCCVRLSRLAFASLGCLSAQAICYWSSLRWPCWAYCVSLVAGLVPHLVFQLVWGSVSAFLGLSGMLVSALFSFAQLSLSPVLSSSWSGMSWHVRALRLSPNFRWDLCSCSGSTVMIAFRGCSFRSKDVENRKASFFGNWKYLPLRFSKLMEIDVASAVFQGICCITNLC